MRQSHDCLIDILTSISVRLIYSSNWIIKCVWSLRKISEEQIVVSAVLSASLSDKLLGLLCFTPSNLIQRFHVWQWSASEWKVWSGNVVAFKKKKKLISVQQTPTSFTNCIMCFWCHVCSPPHGSATDTVLYVVIFKPLPSKCQWCFPWPFFSSTETLSLTFKFHTLGSFSND